MNLKHGFYSLNPAINPDCTLLHRATLGSAELHTLVSLFDDDRLNVGHLINAYNAQGVSLENERVYNLKDWLWWLCERIESQFAYESAQAKYANIAAMIGSAIDEFNIDTSEKIQAMIIHDAKPYSLTRKQFHMNSLVIKLNKLRAKF